MAKNYVTPGEAARILGVCDRTLRYWEEQGKITAIRTAGGQRRYDITIYTTGTTGYHPLCQSLINQVKGRFAASM